MFLRVPVIIDTLPHNPAPEIISFFDRCDAIAITLTPVLQTSPAPIDTRNTAILLPVGLRVRAILLPMIHINTTPPIILERRVIIPLGAEKVKLTPPTTSATLRLPHSYSLKRV